MILPPPSIVIAAGCKTKGLRHLHMEDVKELSSLVDLGQQSMMMILDAEYSMVDLHA